MYGENNPKLCINVTQQVRCEGYVMAKIQYV